MKAHYINHLFHFKFPAGTSRGVLLHKPSSFLLLEKEGLVGIGECSVIPGLSIDPMEQYDQKLQEVCLRFNEGGEVKDIDLSAFPSIAFGLETALLDLQGEGKRILFQNDFSAGLTGIPINGLVWMGNREFMQKQIREKISAGYHCIKLKVGALDFDTELEIIAGIRRQFSAEDIEIRLDANGGFTPFDAMEKLLKLSRFTIHSIEQPVKPRQWETMAEICAKSPIPIVLDEELIGVTPNEELLLQLRPAYIILKPSLIGGFRVSEEWIHLAEKNNIGWWNTSALEANIGLSAIAQWTASLHSDMPQGLGTGQLYHNNIPSPLTIENAQLLYNVHSDWDLNAILK